MSSTRFLTLFGLLLLSATAAFGQGARIGFVNSQAVLEGTAEGKLVVGELETLRQSKLAQIEGKNAELQEMQNRLLEGRTSMNATAIAQLEADISSKQRDLQRFQEDAQAELQNRQNALLQQMSTKVQAVIDEYAKQNNLVAIFMRDVSQAYVDDSLDVTQAIIQAYDQKHPTTPSGTSGQ